MYLNKKNNNCNNNNNSTNDNKIMNRLIIKKLLLRISRPEACTRTANPILTTLGLNPNCLWSIVGLKVFKARKFNPNTKPHKLKPCKAESLNPVGLKV